MQLQAAFGLECNWLACMPCVWVDVSPYEEDLWLFWHVELHVLCCAVCEHCHQLVHTALQALFSIQLLERCAGHGFQCLTSLSFADCLDVALTAVWTSVWGSSSSNQKKTEVKPDWTTVQSFFVVAVALVCVCSWLWFLKLYIYFELTKVSLNWL
jgi:hypothetical protein